MPVLDRRGNCRCVCECVCACGRRMCRNMLKCFFFSLSLSLCFFILSPETTKQKTFHLRKIVSLRATRRCSFWFSRYMILGATNGACGKCYKAVRWVMVNFIHTAVHQRPPSPTLTSSSSPHHPPPPPGFAPEGHCVSFTFNAPNPRSASVYFCIFLGESSKCLKCILI